MGATAAGRLSCHAPTGIIVEDEELLAPTGIIVEDEDPPKPDDDEDPPPRADEDPAVLRMSYACACRTARSLAVAPPSCA